MNACYNVHTLQQSNNSHYMLTVDKLHWTSSSLKPHAIMFRFGFVSDMVVVPDLRDPFIFIKDRLTWGKGDGVSTWHDSLRICWSTNAVTGCATVLIAHAIHRPSSDSVTCWWYRLCTNVSTAIAKVQKRTVGTEQISLRFRRPAVNQQNSAAQTTVVSMYHFIAMESLTALMDPTSSIVVCGCVRWNVLLNSLRWHVYTIQSNLGPDG